MKKKDIMLTSSNTNLDEEKRFEIRDCRVVLKKISTSDIVKWETPGTDCTKLIYPTASSQQTKYIAEPSVTPSDSSLSMANATACDVISPEQLTQNSTKADQLKTSVKFPNPELHLINERRLDEMEKAFLRLKSRIISLEAVVNDQREEIDKLKQAWAQIQQNLDKKEESVQNESSSLHHLTSLKVVRKRNQPFKTPPPTTTSKLNVSFQKKKSDVDFNLIRQNTDFNLNEAGLSAECITFPPQTLPGRDLESDLLIQTSESPETIDLDFIPIKRSRMVKTYSRAIPENVAEEILKAGDEDKNHLNSRLDECSVEMPHEPDLDMYEEKATGKKLGKHSEEISHVPDSELFSEEISRVSEQIKMQPKIFVKPKSQLLATSPSAFPDGWFLKMSPSPGEAPIPRHGCCHFCYEYVADKQVEHCSECQLKIYFWKQAYRQGSIATIPQCFHQLHEPMRGCDGCILRALISKYRLRIGAPIPYLLKNPPVHKNIQADPGASSNLIYSPLSEVTNLPSISTSQNEIPNRISKFPHGWFQVVPDYANKPPTPQLGYCHSCYEYNENLQLQHCEACWAKAKTLKENYLLNPNATNPQCNHQLNQPMRGCEACILRAFVVRYNLRCPDACFPVPYSKVDRLEVITDNVIDTYQESPLTSQPPVSKMIIQNSSSIIEIQRAESVGLPSHIENEQLDEKILSSMPKQWQPPKHYDYISGFPENWFESIPEKTTQLPTPYFGQCTACYEFKRTFGVAGHCELCYDHASKIAKRYLVNPNAPVPKCIHDLNRPMRGCPSCSLRAYILTYNITNPDKPFPIPFEKVSPECTKTRPNKKCGAIDQEPLLPYSDTSELRIESVQSLQPASYPTITGFPDGWFQEVPEDIYQLPTPRCGCCTSCYEYQPRVDGVYCSRCSYKAQSLKSTYESDPDVPLSQCDHYLNRPMRACYICIMRAYILTYNRSHCKPFVVPYEKFHSGVPIGLGQQMNKFVLSNQDPQNPSAEYSPEVSTNIVPGSPLEENIQDDTNSIQIEKCKASPNSVAIDPIPFPDGWFYAVSDEHNSPPIPRPYYCYACYQLISDGKGASNPYFCETCRFLLDDLRNKFLRDPQTTLPQCKHQINQPMQQCDGCIVQTFAFRYQLKFQRPYFQSAPTVTVEKPFPNGWFLEIPSDPGTPPVLRPNQCSACYRRITIRKTSIDNRYCEKCKEKLRRLKNKYIQNRAHPIPYCSHQLNQPMQNCEGCVVKAFLFTFARAHQQPFF